MLLTILAVWLLISVVTALALTPLLRAGAKADMWEAELVAVTGDHLHVTLPPVALRLASSAPVAPAPAQYDGSLRAAA